MGVPMSGTVLVVDDQALARRVLANELTDAGFDVVVAPDGREAWERFERERFDLVITDMVMPKSDGIELLGRIRQRSEVPVILFSAHGSVEVAVTALKNGADDFVSSTTSDVEALVELVRTTLVARRGPPPASALEKRLVGSSSTVLKLRDRVAGLAPLRAPVLIVGERGTGRSTVALALHEMGATAGGPFRRVDTTTFAPGDALPERGAVYLDHVERLSSRAQTFWANRLLDAAQRDYKPYPRVIASMSETRIEGGQFAQELWNELRRFEVALPTLREIRGDVPAMAQALVERHAAPLGRGGIRLSAAALDLLCNEDWPGNIAQLERVIERSIAFTRDRVIPRRVVAEVLADFDEDLASIRARHQTREREALLETIRLTGGNVTRAAERLGRSRGAIYRLIAKYGIRLDTRR